MSWNACPHCEAGVCYSDGQPTMVVCKACNGNGLRSVDEVDDRDDSPVEMTDATLERWDFDSDPDWQ